MSQFDGLVVLQVRQLELSSEVELEDSLNRVVSLVAKQIVEHGSKAKDVTVTGQLNAGPNGAVTGGSATVTTSGNNGSVSVTGQVGPGGQVTGGSVNATWHFD
ncbi:hypothetical protein [Caballeronia sp. INSB1]|uniref:hypothetical protein n=1 Tax=Caballeronia sp. INSB1 TaxID=2921751 RepID=UPI002032F31E|nr:hypothetical protein [Caballeronia sp. INSB1]